MARQFILGAALALATMPAQAGTFTPPAGCEAFLTVQSRGCRVSNHYRCEADAPGDQWRADFDQEGIYFQSRIDREGQWIESLDKFPDVRQTLDPGAEDPASFTDLLKGRDDYRFNLSKDNGERSAVTGYDALTGKSFVIDGITLQQTEFDYVERDPSGNVMRRSRGFEYINPDWRLFFAGPSEWDDGTGYKPYDGSPVQFIFPGEPGFMATQPLFECDAVMSSLPLDQNTTEAPADDRL
ncbi:hypothetical protein [Rhodobacter ferrooxidans]|uniref:Uncharacterized protein n=1 Tax=Rhodobacter ferrooxidans TaxID=371731 RepID=C8S5D4_9RHOB|nr:hypothetical protein [Rhodobacter sp. SW2]EEW23806.1 conserved hypothetical protein [Rhodobacter sp. SW2]